MTLVLWSWWTSRPVLMRCVLAAVVLLSAVVLLPWWVLAIFPVLFFCIFLAGLTSAALEIAAERWTARRARKLEGPARVHL